MKVIKDLTIEIFGSCPSIGEKKRIEYTISDNENSITIFLDKKPILKIDENGKEIKRSADYEAIIDEVRSENMFLFRCSSLGNIMTAPRGKTNKEKYVEALNNLQSKKDRLVTLSEKAIKTKEKLAAEIEISEKDIIMLEAVKDEIEISETAKKEVQKIINETVFGRKKIVSSKEMKKGTEQEDESIRILSEYDSYDYVKNKSRQIDVEYRLTGEYDLKREHEDGSVEIIDIKTRWDIDSFHSHSEEQSKNDSSQLNGYLLLNTDATMATIANILTNNNEDAIRRMIYIESLSYENGDMPKRDQIMMIATQVFDEHTFKKMVWDIVGNIEQDEEAIEAFESFREIPINKRVIKVTRHRDDDLIEKTKKMLVKTYRYAKEKHNFF